MRFFALAAVALVCACGERITTIVPPPPTYSLLLPKSASYWREELQKGFEDGAKQFQLDYVIRDFTEPTANSLLEAAETLPKTNGAPVCIAFPTSEPIRTVVRTLRDDSSRVVSIGEGDALSGRVGHVTEHSDQLAYLVAIRARAIRPAPRRWLLLIGDALVQKTAVKGAFFARSDNWKKYELRVRGVSDAPTNETLEWADLIIAIGSDAVQATSKAKAPVFAVDGSEETLQGVREGKYQFAFVPDYFQMGFRAVRIAREFFVQGSIRTPTLYIPYKEVDKDTLDWFLKRRYDLPPIVRRVD